MIRVDHNRKILALERERDELRAVNCKLRDKLLEMAKECISCDGTGLIVVSVDDREVIHDRDRPIVRTEPCGDCEDIRELLCL